MQKLQKFIPPPRYRRSIIGILAIIIIGGSLYFLGLQIKAGWQEVSQLEMKFDLRWLGVAVVFQALSFTGSILGWHFSLRYVGAPSNVFNAARAFAYSALTRYLPGGIWAFASRIYLAQQAGATAFQATVAQTVELLVLIASSIVVAMISYLISASSEPLWGQWGLLALGLFITASLVIHPRTLRWVLSYRWPGRQSNTPLPENRHFGHALLLISYYVFVWCAGGGAVYALTMAWIPDLTPPFLAVVGLWAAAWLIGFLALPAPGGLGIREGALTLFLSPFMASGIAATLAIVTRLWTTIMEVLLAIIIMFIDWLLPKISTPHPVKQKQ